MISAAWVPLLLPEGLLAACLCRSSLGGNVRGLHSQEIAVTQEFTFRKEILHTCPIFSCYFSFKRHKIDFLFYLPIVFYMIDYFIVVGCSKSCVLISQLIMTPMSTYVFNTSLQVIHQLEKQMWRKFKWPLWENHVTINIQFLTGFWYFLIGGWESESIYISLKIKAKISLWKLLCSAAIFWCRWQACQSASISPSPSNM